MNAPVKYACLSIRHGKTYLIHRPHGPIMYLRNNIFKLNYIQYKCFFSSGGLEINKNKEYSNLLHTYCETDHARDLSYSCSVTSTSHIFNVTVIDWHANKKYKTPKISSSSETRAV